MSGVVGDVEASVEAFNWAAFWGPTLAAAVIATVVSTAVAQFIQLRRRPEPDWSIVGQLTADASHPDGVVRRFITGKLRNTGDGTAHSVQVLNGHLVEAWTEELSPRAYVLAPGAEMVFAGMTLQDDFASATIIIRWCAWPTRLNRWWQVELHLADFFGMDEHVIDATPIRRVRPEKLPRQPKQLSQQPRTQEFPTLRPRRPMQPPRW